MNGACDLAALLDFGGVADVDDEGAGLDLLPRLVGRDARHDSVGCRDQILDTFRHVSDDIARPAAGVAGFTV